MAGTQRFSVFHIVTEGSYDDVPFSIPTPKDDDVCVYERRDHQNHRLWVGLARRWIRVPSGEGIPRQISSRLQHTKVTAFNKKVITRPYCLFVPDSDSTLGVARPASWLLIATARKFDTTDRKLAVDKD